MATAFRHSYRSNQLAIVFDRASRCNRDPPIDGLV
ncbi:MAG: hypothetical protein RIS70_1671 [Planctomycetota bacterium]|jgi:hypothetical protein